MAAEPVAIASLLRPERDRTQIVAYQRGEARTLADFEQRVRAWHAAFAAVSGRRHVLHSADALEFVAALLGAWHAGKCVLVPSDLQLASVQQSGMHIDGYAGVEGGLQPAAPTGEPLPALDPEAVLLEMFTSGSTGFPVAIPKCLRQLEAEIAALAATLEPRLSVHRVVGTVSHQHMYGLMFRVLLPLATCRPFEAIRLSQPQDLSLVDAPEGCVLVTSPAHLTRLPEPGSIHCTVGAVLSAGGPLGADGVTACHDVFGVAVAEIYGSSETGAVAVRMRRPGVMPPWQALPGVELRNNAGRLEILTWQLPTLEWFRSADQVIETADGLELAGRADRIVKLQEKRVSLDAVERVLIDSGLLERVRALVLSGPRPILAIAATPNPAGWASAERGKRQLAEVLREHLRASAQIEVLPRSWRFVDPWPITADGKTPESLLQELFDRRNPEYRVVRQEATYCELQLWVSPTAPHFRGHFPSQPVLAGVVQIDWLVWLCRRLLEAQTGFAGLEAAKFRRVILPDCWLHVTLRHDPQNSRTAYSIAHRGQPCATGRIRWATTP